MGKASSSLDTFCLLDETRGIGLFHSHSPETEIEAETEAFIRELGRAADLTELAKVPLLLCMLIYHRFQHLALPSGRFRAYESIVDHLIITHPRRRRTAALVPGDDVNLTEDDIKPIIRRLSSDDNLLARLSSELHVTPNASQKASIPRLISCARGGMSDIREWSAKELDLQLNGIPELGMDVVTGTIRPVAHALLDVLSLPTV